MAHNNYYFYFACNSTCYETDHEVKLITFLKLKMNIWFLKFFLYKTQKKLKTRSLLKAFLNQLLIVGN